MRALILVTLFFFSASSAEARVRRMYTDAKLPTQQMTEKQTFSNPIAQHPSWLGLAINGPTSAAATTVSTFANSVDVARNIVIAPNGTTGVTGDIENCTIVVSGTNIQNASISENFVFLANATSPVTGSKAFKTVTSLLFPADCESGAFGAKWDIGVGAKLGVKYCMDFAGHILFSTLNGSKEATAPTMAVSASAVESNTATFNGALQGTNDYELFFIQNFGCL